MTRNRKKKLAIRAEADGTSHARAARLHGSAPHEILTADIQDRLIQAFQAEGWPVENDGFPEGGTWTGWLGPVWSMLSRPGGGSDLDADPDDPDHYDLTTVPELTFIAPRIPINTGEAMVLTLPATTPLADIVHTVGAELARARATKADALVNAAQCSLCGDKYPAAHLLPATESDRLLLCPFCVFDGDILHSHPLRLAYAIDALTDEDIAAPAGWSAVTALLACAAGPDLRERLEGDDGVLRLPLPHWFDPGQVWVWLPPGDLPPALQDLGPGTRLDTLVSAVEAAHPDLRDRFRAEVAATLEEDEEDGGGEDARDYLVEELWPAALCYAVTAATQARERPTGHSPWDLLGDGFEEGNMAESFHQIGSTLDADALGPMFTLSIGVPVISEALGFSPTA
ncbi:hypothetical protein GCM10010425_49110 [Streptomyces spororaveus]|uniref:TniQ protein n=1 Tax=Streptomyces spororaveus TaxID=284039 RepID=A0ABQ3T3A7_9ACTN|nr:hypothetical protein [Streptomyces spororaveus]GHI74505.1 hypothetical protein Sspor_00660 [Streptomyces spororaveus]